MPSYSFSRRALTALAPLWLMLLVACSPSDKNSNTSADATKAAESAKARVGGVAGFDLQRRIDDYATVSLTTDTSVLSASDKKLIAPLIEAAKIMNDLFWRQSFGDDYAQWLLTLEPKAAALARLNYGPWDRLDGNRVFVEGIHEKPKGANFYPADMSIEEFEAAEIKDKRGLYSVIRRADDGSLRSIAYHELYAEQLAKAAALLREASMISADENFAAYLLARADALVSGDYRESDLLWMDSKSSQIDVVIGAIETYEDQLFGYRAAFEAYVLVKDVAWSERLARFSAFLPQLQRGLPVPEKYRAQMPGTDADLNAYDVVYYAGDSNAGSKTIAINLPNDETVQLEKGTRRLQLKNAMRAKFDKILLPIADALVDPSQRSYVSFDAFFANTMFHEVAHGLGIKTTLDGSQTVRGALRDYASSIEEGKADILGLYMITRLHEAGELGEAKLMDNYVTFMASVFRSIRFGASSAHGRANTVRFNFFLQQGAFIRDAKTGFYKVDFERMQKAMDALAAKILILQGDGDYAAAASLTAEFGVIGEQLAADLERLSKQRIPVDIVFEQGLSQLGL